jgi:hypothetical protein
MPSHLPGSLSANLLPKKYLCEIPNILNLNIISTGRSTLNRARLAPMPVPGLVMLGAKASGSDSQVLMSLLR